MLDVARSGLYGGKLRLLCQRWYVWSTWICQTNILTVTKMGIVKLTIQYDTIFSVSFRYDPRDSWRQTSQDILSCEAYPVYIGQSWDFSGCKPLWIFVNNQTTSDRLIANHRFVRNSCNLQSNAAWFNLNELCNSAVTYFILTCSEVYIPQDFPLLFTIIFLSYSTPANHGNINTSARLEWHRTRWINGRYTQLIILWHTARMQTRVSSPQCCQCGHQK